MKRSLLLIAITTLSFVSIQVSAQKHAFYVSAGPSMSLNNGHYVSIGAEIGAWGIESKTTLGAAVSYTPDTKDWYVGFKPYYTIKDHKNYCIMFYACPQIQLTNDKLFIMEEGFWGNLNLSKSFLWGVSIGAQHYKGNAFQPVASTGLVYLLRK